jgi:glucosamine 6-phosphate synthetase-like amidotransferase/phosphosugar isomerase protein
LKSRGLTLNSHSQAIAKLELQMEQMAKQIEEEEFQRQSEADLDRYYVMDESTSYHEQTITTMNMEKWSKFKGREEGGAY